MREYPKPNEIYRHFKGNYYKIVTLARHSETGEMMVVYEALYGDGATYVRPLDMFLSPVDRTKYPETDQDYRFELAKNAVDPGVMEFLDCESYEERIKVLTKLHLRLNMDMVNTIAVSLDFEVSSTDVEVSYEELMNYLTMQARYETNRLR